MSRVLVTGATGFLGGYVVRLLEDKGYEVIAFGRNHEKGRLLTSDTVTFIQGDLRCLADVMKASKDCDYVIHSGALSTVWGRWKEFYDINVVGTKNVLKACEHHHIKRLVFVSSPSIYSSPCHKEGIKEEDYDPENDLNHYIKSKILAEEEIHNYHDDSFEKVIIRPRGLFGVGDTSVIPRLLDANEKVGIPLFNKGNNLVDITYVENVAHSLLLAITTSDIDGEVFNITNGEPMKFIDILDMFLSKISRKPKYLKLYFKPIYALVWAIESVYCLFKITKEPLFTRYTLTTLGFSQTLDIQKARTRLGYSPLYSIEEGIDIYAKWFNKQH